jgi:hypothetical protein
MFFIVFPEGCPLHLQAAACQSAVYGARCLGYCHASLLQLQMVAMHHGDPFAMTAQAIQPR